MRKQLVVQHINLIQKLKKKERKENCRNFITKRLLLKLDRHITHSGEGKHTHKELLRGPGNAPRRVMMERNYTKHYNQ